MEVICKVVFSAVTSRQTHKCTQVHADFIIELVVDFLKAKSPDIGFGL